MRFILFVMLTFSLNSLAECEAQTAAGAAGNESLFLKAVQTHITAIANRDFETLLSTITNGEQLTLVFPDGTTLYTRQEYVDFHTAWFADEEWLMNIEILSQQVRGDHGVALVRTTYTDQAGPRQAMLALHFTREEGEWRLFFDQNTRIVTAQ